MMELPLLNFGLCLWVQCKWEYKNNTQRPSKMAQQVQMLANMPDDLSSIPRALLVGGTDSHRFSFDSHIHAK